MNVNDVIALAAEDEDEVAEVKAMDVSQFKGGVKDTKEEVKKEVKTEVKIENKPEVKTDSGAKTPSNLPETKILISPSAKAIFETNNLTFKSAFSHKFITKIDALNMI